MVNKLSKQDLQNIGELVDVKMDQKLKGVVDPVLERINSLPTREEFEQLYNRINLSPTKDEFDRLYKRINLLPTKDEFFRKMDEVVTELQTTRDEQVVMNGQITGNTERIENLEEHVGIKTE